MGLGEYDLEKDYPNVAQCYISIPPEDIGKPLVFWCFQGV